MTALEMNNLFLAKRITTMLEKRLISKKAYNKLMALLLAEIV